MVPKTIQWCGGLDGQVELIDQTLLPGELKILAIRDVEGLWEAIRALRVRGAPAIGIAAAMGVVLGIAGYEGDEANVLTKIRETCDYLSTARPTAVNLFWALSRMQARTEELRGRGTTAIKAGLLAEAKAIRDEDAAMCRSIGRHAAALIKEGQGVLTHCNAGWLATAEYGTALAGMYTAHEEGRRFQVYVDETRPLLQGSRLTAWELGQAGIDTTLICDNMAGQLMKEGRVDLVVTGADRIAANGDTANKIGTYSLAVLAKAHGIPFYVAAPTCTFDLSIDNGDGIPIEERGADEVRGGFGRATAPADVGVYNPAFDVTPAELIAAIVTEAGVIRPVCLEKIENFFARRGLKNRERAVESAP